MTMAEKIDTNLVSALALCGTDQRNSKRAIFV